MDGYNSEAEMEAACPNYIDEQLNSSGTSLQVERFEAQAKTILDYLEHLSDKELGPTWTEHDWRGANQMRVWFLRDVLKDPDWQDDGQG